MKKFVLKIFLFAGIMFSILFLLNLRWTRTKVYMVQDQKYRTLNPPKSIHICSTGSSHGMFSFDYSCLPLGYTGFNFARTWQSFYYDLQLLKQYESNLEEGSVIFIPVSYFSFYQRYDDDVARDGEHIYYNFLSYKYVRHPSVVQAIKTKWLPILDIGSDQIQYLLRDNKNAIEEFEARFKENKYLDEETGLFDYKQLLDERDSSLVAHTQYFDSGVNSEAVETLKELLEHCIQRGYQCILITTPLSEYYNAAEAFDEAFLDQFFGLVNEISCEFGVPYWNYSHDDRFTNDLYLFWDDDHLNYYGRNLFSEMVFDRAVNEGYLDENR